MAKASKINLDTKGIDAVAKKAQMLTRYKVEYVPINSISPNTYNPNRQSSHDFELLCRSIKEDGFTQPIIVQTDSRHIVDGEHRWRAAREVGISTIPVVFVDWSEEQCRIATLRHNRARGSEDVELASQVLRDLRELGSLEWAQDSLMISDEELTKLAGDVSVPDQLAGDDYAEAWTPTRENKYDQAPDHANEEHTGTTAAREAQAQLQQRLQSAQGEQERQAIIKAHTRDAFRLVVSFDGDEARLVKEVLGDRKAEKLLALCEARLAAE